MALRAALLAEFGGKTIQAENYERLLDLLQEGVSRRMHRPTLWDSVRSTAGETMTHEVADELAWRIAGNAKRIHDRYTVPPWHIQRLTELAPLQITACKRARNARHKLGAMFTCRVLAGTAASMILMKFWTLKQCRYFAHGFGFSKRPRLGSPTRPRYPYAAPEMLVGLRFGALFDPEKSGASGPGFSQLWFPKYIVEWNQRLLKKRCRVRVSDCPARQPPSRPCHRCDAGYETCPAGTHRKNWVCKPCTRCGAAEAYFDPELDAKACIDCFVMSVYRQKKEA